MPADPIPEGTEIPVANRAESDALIDSEVAGYAPDLILVQATNGESGYAFNRDLSYGGYPGETINPNDAIAYMEWRKAQSGAILIPVYDVNRDNVVGYFAVSSGSPDDMTPEEELEMVVDHTRKSTGMAE